MLDRKLAPIASKVKYSVFPQVRKSELSSGVPLYSLCAGTQQVLKFEITFQSGSWHESQKSQSWLAAKMLTEGTSHLSATQVTEKFEALGAFVDITPGFDDVSIGVYCLRRNFEEVIKHLNVVLNDATFPDKELQLLKGNRVDQIKLNDQDDSQFASKKIRESLFGADYPYGIGLKPEDILDVDLAAVRDFYDNYLFTSPQLFVSGAVDSGVAKIIAENLSINFHSKHGNTRKLILNTEKNIFVERKNSLQSALRMAWHIPDKHDPEYFNFLITNCVLGGYFGSRLMKNIREDKGFTYGINSYPVHLSHHSFAILSTDVKAESTASSISEIWSEIEKLKTETITNDELENVVNYMAGSFLNSINTPFQLMKKFDSIHKFGLEYDYYESFFESLANVTPEEILKTTQSFFNRENAHMVVVGSMD